MSKIAQALEKAARERLKVWQQQPTVSYDPAKVSNSKVDQHLVSYFDPKSPIAEQYRILRANLMATNRSRPPQVIVVTSAIMQEGKSLTSANLAVVMAQSQNRQVLLVDADLRRGTVKKLFALDSQPGLSEVLQGKAPLERALVRTAVPQLTLVAGGKTPTQPAELLESSSMREFVSACRERFDVIILDAPPIVSISDAGIIGRCADGVVLVVQAGRTQRKLVLRAYELLKQVQVNVLGFVLTHADYYVPYYHYYQKYYGTSTDREEARPEAEAPAAGASPSPLEEAAS
jgi:capsular exopolysaccharide synthesis family protein